jgi:hypothetical protein
MKRQENFKGECTARNKEAQQQAAYRNWRVCQKRNEAAPESNGRHIGTDNLEATKYGKFC